MNHTAEIKHVFYVYLLFMRSERTCQTSLHFAANAIFSRYTALDLVFLKYSFWEKTTKFIARLSTIKIYDIL